MTVKTLKTFYIEEETEDGDFIKLDIHSDNFCTLTSCLGGIEEDMLLTDVNLYNIVSRLAMYRKLD